MPFGAQTLPDASLRPPDADFDVRFTKICVDLHENKVEPFDFLCSDLLHASSDQFVFEICCPSRKDEVPHYPDLPAKAPVTGNQEESDGCKWLRPAVGR